MKKISAFIVVLFFSLSLFAQKQINDANAQVRDVKNFHAIKVSTGIELTLTQGESEAVAVSASDLADRDKIKTVVENGVLKIYFDVDAWKWWRDNRGNKKLRAYVSIVKIDDLDMSAGALVKVEGELKSDKLGLDISSGAQFNGKVSVGSLNVDQSSGAQVNISGKASSINIDGSSGSVFNGYELIVENADIDTSSGSVAELTINKELSAEASSGGSIRFKGEGVIRNIKTGSGGAVSKRS